MGADERLLCNFLNRTTPFPRRAGWRSGWRYQGPSAVTTPAVQAGIAIEDREIQNGGEVLTRSNSSRTSSHEASQAASRPSSESNELDDASELEAPNVVSVQRDWIMRLEDEYLSDSSDSEFKEEGEAQPQSRSTPISSIVKAHDVDFHAAYKHDCAICLNTELGAPQMLGCGHVFCIRCIQRHVCAQLRARQWPPCPICKRRVAADELEELRQRRAEADHAQGDSPHSPCAARPSTANLEYLNNLLERLPRNSDSSGASSFLHAETTSEGSLRSPDGLSMDESPVSSTFDAFSIRSPLASFRRMQWAEPSQTSLSAEGYVPYVPFVPYAPYIDDAHGNAPHGIVGGRGGGRGGGGDRGSGGTRGTDAGNADEGHAGVAQPGGVARRLQDLYGRFQGARQHVRQQLRCLPQELASPGRSWPLALRLTWRSPRGEV